MESERLRSNTAVKVLTEEELSIVTVIDENDPEVRDTVVGIKRALEDSVNRHLREIATERERVSDRLRRLLVKAWAPVSLADSVKMFTELARNMGGIDIKVLALGKNSNDMNEVRNYVAIRFDNLEAMPYGATTATLPVAFPNTYLTSAYGVGTELFTHLAYNKDFNGSSDTLKAMAISAITRRLSGETVQRLPLFNADEYTEGLKDLNIFGYRSLFERETLDSVTFQDLTDRTSTAISQLSNSMGHERDTILNKVIIQMIREQLPDDVYINSGTELKNTVQYGKIKLSEQIVYIFDLKNLTFEPLNCVELVANNYRLAKNDLLRNSIHIPSERIELYSEYLMLEHQRNNRPESEIDRRTVAKRSEVMGLAGVMSKKNDDTFATRNESYIYRELVECGFIDTEKECNSTSGGYWGTALYDARASLTPHAGLSESYSACLGSIQSTITNAMGGLDITVLAMAVKDFLTTYNLSDIAGVGAIGFTGLDGKLLAENVKYTYVEKTERDITEYHTCECDGQDEEYFECDCYDPDNYSDTDRYIYGEKHDFTIDINDFMNRVTVYANKMTGERRGIIIKNELTEAILGDASAHFLYDGSEYYDTIHMEKLLTTMFDREKTDKLITEYRAKAEAERVALEAKREEERRALEETLPQGTGLPVGTTQYEGEPDPDAPVDLSHAVGNNLLGVDHSVDAGNWDAGVALQPSGVFRPVNGITTPQHAVAPFPVRTEETTITLVNIADHAESLGTTLEEYLGNPANYCTECGAIGPRCTCARVVETPEPTQENGFRTHTIVLDDTIQTRPEQPTPVTPAFVSDVDDDDDDDDDDYDDDWDIDCSYGDDE